MKKFVLSALLLGLFSCSQEVSTPLVENIDTTTAQSAPDKNFLESFSFYYSAPTTVLDDTGLSEVLSQVKSFTGSVKYDNRNSATRYRLLIKTSNDDIGNSGKIRLGKNGKVYMENWISSSAGSKSKFQYLEIGSYEKPNTALKSGTEIKIKENSNISFKFKGRGLNPMNHDEIQIISSKDIKPEIKDSKDFL